MLLPPRPGDLGAATFRGVMFAAMLLVFEQFLNGLQLGLLLFLLAAGLTLVFGIMDLVNLAHGSLYMLGAYFAATFTTITGSFLGGVVLALAATLLWAWFWKWWPCAGCTAATTSTTCSQLLG